jgi:hypothetical protein
MVHVSNHKPDPIYLKGFPISNLSNNEGIEGLLGFKFEIKHPVANLDGASRELAYIRNQPRATIGASLYLKEYFND